MLSCGTPSSGAGLRSSMCEPKLGDRHRATDGGAREGTAAAGHDLHPLTRAVDRGLQRVTEPQVSAR